MRSAVFNSVLLVMVLILLAGCTTKEYIYVPVQAQLPAVPEDLRKCFAGVYNLPAEAEWSAEQTAIVVKDIRLSELRKTHCGRRLLAFFDLIRADLPMGPR